MLGWSQTRLARASRVSLPTIQRLEAGEGRLGGRHVTITSLEDTLSKHGVEFISENGGGAGVRLKKR